jgi:hypothetical protein
MKDNKVTIKVWIILVIILLVLLYMLSWGKADFLTEGGEARKLRLGEKKKILENRYKRVQEILSKKKTLKRKLETLCTKVLLGVRIGLTLLLIGIIYIAHLFFLFTLLELGEYFGLAAIVILIIGFVLIGSPTNFFSLWNYFEKKLILMIYGKYIDIDKHIEFHEKELQAIVQNKVQIDKESFELLQAELEIKKILEDKSAEISGAYHSINKESNN